MIDLEEPGLPDEIGADGGWVRVLTDFRTWLRFGRLLDAGLWWDGIFPAYDNVPRDWHDGALEFYRSPVACPHGQAGRSGARPLDLSLDGDYVVGSFQAAYGIDLTDQGLDMHWHRFLALLRSLPEGSMVARIGAWRTWTRAAASERPEAAARRLRAAWALPSGPAGAAGAVDAQREVFGGVVEAFAREREWLDDQVRGSADE